MSGEGPLELRSFAALYDAYAESLLVFFARRTCDVEVALDLTAETFAQAFAGRRSFRGGSDQEAVAWLYGIARHQLARFFRRGGAERRAVERLGVRVPQISEDDYSRIEQLVGLEQQRAAIAAALTGLSVDQREALWLRVVEELPYAVVAEQLAVSEQTARMRVSRGLRRWRRLSNQRRRESTRHERSRPRSPWGARRASRRVHAGTLGEYAVPDETPTRGSPRQRLVVPVFTALALVLVAVAIVIGSGGAGPTAATALERAAVIASRGASPPELHAGEYWYTRSVITTPLPISLSGGPNPPKVEVIQRVVSESWVGSAGEARVRDSPLGRPRFRSSSDRQRWLAAGSPAMNAYVGADDRILRGHEFPAGFPLFSYRQVQSLPTDPSALLDRLREALSAAFARRAPGLSLTPTIQRVAEFNTIDGLLISPITPAVAAALYRAAAKIPGVRYIGTGTDPLGRRGVAVELDTPGQHRRIIFDPRTAALLSQLSDFGGPPHPGIYDSESYVVSAVVSSVKSLPAGVGPAAKPTPLAQRRHPQ